tara:strand:- start:290 stop:817 length:528 start_codon:yes stop_codon:yes gene_type:complete
MEETPHLDIDELYETKQKIDINRVNLYNKLILRIHTKIKISSKQRTNNNFCYYVMPEVLVGFPNYDFNECLLYIISSLENDGFLLKYIHPNLLLISWNHWIPQYVRDEIRKKTGKNVDKFGNEIENKTNENKLDTIKKSVSFENDKKTKNINEKYVPSGKFIYGNDLLNTLRDKI